MAKWKLELAPEMIPVPVDPREFNRLLADLSEILYRCFSQLDPRFKKSPSAQSIGTSVTLKGQVSK